MQLPWKTKGIVLTAPLTEEVDNVVKFIDEYLAPRGCNLIAMQIRYRYRFKRHPECMGYDPLSYEDVKKIVAVCKKHGIRLIPKMNLHGHQSGLPNTPTDGILHGHHEKINDIRDGLLRARWPARFEIISRDPLTVYDGAHNREGVCAAAESVKQYFGCKKLYAVSGVLRDKEYEEIARIISTFAVRVYTVTPDNPRALSAEEYAEVFRKNGIEAIPSASIEKAVISAREAAREAGVPLICLGSLYTYGEVVKALDK